MPSLEQLYSKSPLEQYGGLSLGLRMGMGPEEFGQYEARQQEYNRQIDELNRRASEINPYIVEQQRLENQQKQYLMPTHQASGIEAQAKMKTPGFYDAIAKQKMAEAQSGAAKANVEAAAAQGQLPYAKGISEATEKLKERQAQVSAAIAEINAINPNDPNALAALREEDPEFYSQFEGVINSQGIGGFKAAAINFLTQQQQLMALNTPEHTRKMQEIRAQIQGQKDIAGINAQAKSQAEKEFDAYIKHYKAAHPGASDYEAHSAFISARYQPTTTIMGPDGRPLITQQKGTPPAPTGAPVTTPQSPQSLGQITISGVKYDVIGKNQDGSVKIKDPKTGKTGTYRP